VPGAGFCFSTPVATLLAFVGAGDGDAEELFAVFELLLTEREMLSPSLHPVARSTSAKAYKTQRLSNVIPEDPSPCPARGVGRHLNRTDAASEVDH
jgi:hypothetical protein